MSNVQKNNRVLLIVVNLSSEEGSKLYGLYEWFDKNCISLANMVLGDHYREIVPLKDNVTSRFFLERLINLANAPSHEAVDVILSLHGLNGKLCFGKERIPTKEISERLRAENLKNKLRLLYSGACYGNTHSADFIKAGFRVASGAIGVAANGAFDFPLQMYNWAKGETYEKAVKAGNLPIGIDISDGIARALGYDKNEVNSFKRIKGNKNTYINSPAY